MGDNVSYLTCTGLVIQISKKIFLKHIEIDIIIIRYCCLLYTYLVLIKYICIIRSSYNIINLILSLKNNISL